MKVGNAELSFSGETDPGCCGGKGPVVREKAREREKHTGKCTRRMFLHNYWFGKTED